ncbi:hypothetical protein C8R44DRAFT_866412 [Mycena epipterygia]|nr:hypothetical protein C8R44DRAFT_866412 [Mycena epipterygia]
MREFLPELIEQVINCHANHSTDLDAMKICGLVCKGWFPCNRYHLFSTVRLTTNKLGSFFDLIDHSSLPMLDYIRHLTLHYECIPFDGLKLERLHHCPNLTNIELVVQYSGTGEVGWLARDSLHTHLRSWSAKAVSLSRVDLSCRDFVALPVLTMICLLSCFPSLETVGIDSLYTFEGDTDLYPAFAPTHLANLDIYTFHRSNLFFSWLLSLAVPPILKTFKFRGTSSDLEPLQIFIRRAGGELESLFVEMLGPWEGESG